MAPRFLNPDTLPSPIFTTTNTRQFVPGTPVHPLHDLNLQEEDFTLIPPPLFAGKKRRPCRHLPAPAVNTLLSGIELIDEIDDFYSQFHLGSRDTTTEVKDSSSQNPSHASPSQSFDLWPAVRLDVLPNEGDIDAEDSASMRSHGSLSIHAVDGRVNSRPSISIDDAIQDQLTAHQTRSHSPGSSHAPRMIPSPFWKDPPLVSSSQKPSFDWTVAEHLTKFRLGFGRPFTLESPPVSPKTIPINLSDFGTYVRPESPHSSPGLPPEEVSHLHEYF